MITQLRFKIANARDHWQELINRVVAQMIRCGMSRFSFGWHLHLEPALMATIDLHFGRLADDDKIGPDFGIDFDECVGSNTITLLLHVAEVIGSPAFEQA